jgi:Arc/MetJ-type ribon-helix-helix transcriptional regulator
MRKRLNERKKSKNGLVVITIAVPDDWIRQVDQLVDRGFYASRAECIRAAIRDLLDVEYQLIVKREKGHGDL